MSETLNPYSDISLSPITKFKDVWRSEAKGIVLSFAERIMVKSMPGNVYRILAKDVRSYEFIIPYDEKADVGEIFTVEDRDMLFLARVVNVQHDSNYNGRWDTSIRGTELYDEEQIFNRVIAEPLGCIPRDQTKRRGAFRKAKTIPTKFSKVKRTEAEEFGFLKDTILIKDLIYPRVPIEDPLDTVQGVHLRTGPVMQHLDILWQDIPSGDREFADLREAVIPGICGVTFKA